MLLWLDLETTGLSAAREYLLEVAAIATDDEYNEVARFERVIYWEQSYDLHRAMTEADAAIARRPTVLGELTNDQRDGVYWSTLDRYHVSQIDLVVAKMHHKSGLWERSAHGEALATVQRDLARFILEHATRDVEGEGGTLKRERPQLAGSTISFDRGFIEHHMPEVEKLLHHRNLDVSTLNELARRFLPNLHKGRPSDPNNVAHRAMLDIEESLAVAKSLHVRVDGAPVMSGPNPSRYRRMLEPHADLDTANAALQKFFAAVEKAREEFRIADVTVITEVIIDQDEHRAQASCHFGSRMNMLPMVARAYGTAREQHEQLIADVIAGARKQERSR